MDCLNQFQFYVQKTTTFTTASGEFTTWTPVGGSSSWVVKSGANNFIFDIQGFKNIDLYGIKILGDIQSGTGGVSQGIVDDYNFRCYLSGEFPSVSGIFTSNTYNALTIPTFCSLSKYQNEITFIDPIKSCKTIEVSVFSAQGINPRSATQIILDVNFNIYFYYKYQGED